MELCGVWGCFLSILSVSAVLLYSKFSIPPLNTRFPLFYCLPAVLRTRHILLLGDIVFPVFSELSPKSQRNLAFVEVSPGQPCWFAAFLPSLFALNSCPIPIISPARRNSLGGDVLFVGKHHPLCDFIVEQYKTKNTEVGCTCCSVEMVRWEV